MNQQRIDTVRKFAETVAPLYIMNDWLGLGDATISEAVERVHQMTKRLYDRVLEAEVSFDHPFYFVSTGRVMVVRYFWSDEPDEIELNLSLEREVPHEITGEFYNLNEWGEGGMFDEHSTNRS